MARKGALAKAKAGAGKGRAAAAPPDSPAPKRSRRASGVEPTDAYLREAVASTLTGVFRGWTQEEIYAVEVDNKTLYKRLWDDKKTWCIDGTPALSAPYFLGLKQKYRSVPVATDELKMDNSLESYKTPIRPSLLNALALLKLARPCRVALSQWQLVNKELTQKDRARERIKFGGEKNNRY